MLGSGSRVSGKNPDRIIQAAKFCGQCREQYRANAAPWENPPMMILSLGMPFRISPSIISNTTSADRLTPSMSVSSSSLSKDSMSNQAGIRNPMLSVIGMTGAVGQITLMWSGRIVLRIPAHPWPVSPSPCRNTIEAVCLIRGWRITGRILAILALPSVLSGEMCRYVLCSVFKCVLWCVKTLFCNTLSW